MDITLKPTEEIDFVKLVTNLAESELILRAKASLEEFYEYCQKNETQLNKEFRQPFQDLFKKANILQNQGKQQEIAYLAITVLRSLIMEHCYQLRLDLYNASFYLDPVECSAYLNLDYLFKYIDADIDPFIADLKDCGCKYTTYEIERYKKEYLEFYAAVAQTYIEQNLPLILELKEFGTFKKTPDFKIIYGDYYDKTVTLYDATPESSEG